jgi:hypothetical protein
MPDSRADRQRNCRKGDVLSILGLSYSKRLENASEVQCETELCIVQKATASGVVPHAYSIVMGNPL